MPFLLWAGVKIAASHNGFELSLWRDQILTFVLERPLDTPTADDLIASDFDCRTPAQFDAMIFALLKKS